MPIGYPAGLTMGTSVPQMYDNDGGDATFIVGRVSKPGSVNSVEFIPGWTQAGVTTNSRTLSLYNRGPLGAGSTVIATLALTAGVDLTKFVSKTIPITAANAVIAIGDILEWESLHVGSGQPDPGGQVIVQQSFNP